MDTKICTVCSEEKTLDSFYNSKFFPGGKSYRCKACDKIAGKAYREKHKERDRINRKFECLKRKYGLSKEEFYKRLEDQEGKCGCCGVKLTDEFELRHDRAKLVVDHCHNSNEIRGFLCTMCNKGIGLLGDNLEGIKKALKYLEKSASVH